MTQQTLSEIRSVLASYLAANIPDLVGAVSTRLGEITPPCAVVLPETGDFASYSATFDGQVDYVLRVVLLVPMSGSDSGQDALDPFLSVTGPDSIWAAIQKDPTLGGGVIGYAAATKATAYGERNVAGVDYMSATIIVEIGD